MGSTNNIKCDKCNKTFTAKRSLYAHSRRIHGFELVQLKEKKEACLYCDKSYSSKTSLNYHYTHFHGKTDYQTTKSRLMCPFKGCDELAQNYEKLRHHIRERHHLDIEMKEFNFSNYNDFIVWKSGIEDKKGCNYIKMTRNRVLSNSITKAQYVCNCKVNKKYKKMLCPSVMDVTGVINGEKTINVKYWLFDCIKPVF